MYILYIIYIYYNIHVLLYISYYHYWRDECWMLISVGDPPPIAGGQVSVNVGNETFPGTPQS